MKKILLAAMVGICITSCTGNEDFEAANNAPKKISFASPLVKTTTRGQYSPEIGEFKLNDYNVNEWFHVYAVLTDGTYKGTEDWSTKFMDEDAEPYKVDEYSYPDYWEPIKPYYWPKNPNLYITFAAFSPARASGEKTYDSTGLTITDFELPMDRGTQYELLYSKRAFNKKQNDNTQGQYLSVNIEFQRALSAIDLNVSTDNGEGKVWLKRLSIVGARDKATFKENVTNQATTYVANPKWTNHSFKNAPTNTSEREAFNGPSYDIGQSQVDRENSFMIPQTLSDDVKLIIEWEYQNGDRIDKEQDSYTLQLNTLNIKTWEPGKKYTYNIKINLDKIYFNPSVEDWSTATPSIGNVTP